MRKEKFSFWIPIIGHLVRVLISLGQKQLPWPIEATVYVKSGKNRLHGLQEMHII